MLSERFLAFADKVRNSSQSELFDLGVNTFVITPLIDRVFYKVEDEVVNIGKKIGLDYLTVYPDLEGTYEIDNNSMVRSTYNYTFNEIRLEYQRSFK